MQKWSKNIVAAIKLAIVKFYYFPNMCFPNCLESMHGTNTPAHQRVFNCILLLLNSAAVQTTSGLPILPQGQLTNLMFINFLFVV